MIRNNSNSTIEVVEKVCKVDWWFEALSSMALLQIRRLPGAVG